MSATDGIRVIPKPSGPVPDATPEDGPDPYGSPDPDYDPPGSVLSGSLP